MLAETAANAGVPAMRFDYRGCGDSSDLDHSADQIAAWTEDVLKAIAELERMSGVERIVLVGTRLGALIATLAAERCNRVLALILIAPVIDGLAYVRELHVTRLVSNAIRARESRDTSKNCHKDEAARAEAGGFFLSAASITSLEGIRIDGRKWPRNLPGLIIDGKAMARTKPLFFTGDAPKITYLTVPGIVRMISRPPLQSKLPPKLFGAAMSWLRDLSTGLPGYSAPPGLTAIRRLPLRKSTFESRLVITETPVIVPSDTTLFCIVSEPGKQRRLRSGIVLLNSGADHHVGPSRLHVNLARRWASEGHFVFRVDLSGLGDSAAHTGLHDSEPFPRYAVSDIRAIVHFARTHYGIDYLALGGLCSGAYHALQAAVHGLGPNAIFLINPWNSFWSPRMPSNSPLNECNSTSDRVVSKRSRGSALLKPMRRAVLSIPRLVRSNACRLLMLGEYLAFSVSHAMGVSPNRAPWYQIDAALERKIRVVICFADSEPSAQLLGIHQRLRRHTDKYMVHVIQGGDHIFSGRQSRMEMADLLSKELAIGLDLHDVS